LAAVSGGADSMAMLAALCAVADGREIFCLHVEHGLRPAEETRGDAEFVRSFCEENHIKHSIVSIPPGKIAAYAQRKGIGIEAAARFFRHRALLRQAKRLGKNTLILIAHTNDDLLETALMRILRGAGSAGLAAMPSKRGRILRPVLKMTRADVIDYLTAKNISWRDDSTNTDTRFLRNRIRRQLVPLLNEAFPSWKTGVFSVSETQSLTAAFLAGEAAAKIKWEIHHEGAKGAQREEKNIHPFSPSSPLWLKTEENNFFSQPQIIREEALFLAIDKLLEGVKNARTVKRSVVRRFCEGEVNAADLGSVRIKRENGKILLSRVKKEFFESGISKLIKG